jgi:hypothetical protein
MMIGGFRARALCVSAASALLAGCGGPQAPINAPTFRANGDVAPYQHTFTYTGGEQTFRVPTGVTQLTVVARGGAGARQTDSREAVGGRGGRVFAIVPVRPGEKLYVYVGGAGGFNGGGFNGGANGGGTRGSYFSGYGGGGASDVREGGRKLADRIIVAGGGGGEGGAGYGYPGGAGGKAGGLVGGSGDAGCCSSVLTGGGGHGGTQLGGGSGGSGPGLENPGSDGSLGAGGTGGSGCSTISCASGAAGGGGGGGYYGGGGGGTGFDQYYYYYPGGGGGGGSSYAEASAINFRTWSGWKKATGDGLVVLSWQ